MSEMEKVEPHVALSRFLAAVKTQADVDPQFRNSLLLALGVAIYFEGEDELLNIEPHIVAARKDELQFRAIFGQLSAAKLRSVLTSKSKLASAADVRGKNAGEMIDMLYERARARAEERGLI